MDRDLKLAVTGHRKIYINCILNAQRIDRLATKSREDRQTDRFSGDDRQTVTGEQKRGAGVLLSVCGHPVITVLVW